MLSFSYLGLWSFIWFSARLSKASQLEISNYESINSTPFSSNPISLYARDNGIISTLIVSKIETLYTTVKCEDEIKANENLFNGLTTSVLSKLTSARNTSPSKTMENLTINVNIKAQLESPTRTISETLTVTFAPIPGNSYIFTGGVETSRQISTISSDYLSSGLSLSRPTTSISGSAVTVTIKATNDILKDIYSTATIVATEGTFSIPTTTTTTRPKTTITVTKFHTISVTMVSFRTALEQTTGSIQTSSFTALATATSDLGTVTEYEKFYSMIMNQSNEGEKLNIGQRIAGLPIMVVLIISFVTGAFIIY